MKTLAKNILKFLVFASFGGLLFWLVYKDVPRDEIVSALRAFDYRWLWLSLFLGLMSHVSRAMRWRILIEGMGYKPKLSNTFFAVMVMYLSNLAIPRMGEVVRCGIIKKYEKIPLSNAFGTVVLERSVDFVMLIAVFFVVLFTQFGVIMDFVANNPGMNQKFMSVWHYKFVLLGLGVLGLAVLFVLYRNRERLEQFGIYLKIKEKVIGFYDGLKTIVSMERKWAFWLHSMFIYTMYFAMVYVSFFGFGPTQHLGVFVGLTVFVMASFGMVAPVSGGIGPWHFMVIETLFVYGIDRLSGASFAFILHTAQNLMLAIVGLISLILLPIFNVKEGQKTEKDPVSEP